MSTIGVLGKLPTFSHILGARRRQLMASTGFPQESPRCHGGQDEPPIWRRGETITPSGTAMPVRGHVTYWCNGEIWCSQGGNTIAAIRNEPLCNLTDGLRIFLGISRPELHDRRASTELQDVTSQRDRTSCCWGGLWTAFWRIMPPFNWYYRQSYQSGRWTNQHCHHLWGQPPPGTISRDATKGQDTWLGTVNR